MTRSPKLITLYPTLEDSLVCPSRYWRAVIGRETVAGPFASTAFGQEVHSRVAASLRTKQAVNRQPIKLPRLLMLQNETELLELSKRAFNCLTDFEHNYRPELMGSNLRLGIEQTLSYDIEMQGESLRFVGKVDLLVEQGNEVEIWDWKTGSPQGSRRQLRLYLFLYYLATGKTPTKAQAVGLGTGEMVQENWSGEVLQFGYTWLGDTLRALKEATIDPKVLRPGAACRYCPYGSSCGASQAPQRVLFDTRDNRVIEPVGESLFNWN